MDLQQKQINALANWLTVAEQRINSSEAIGSDLDTVKRQVENHKVWNLISLVNFLCSIVDWKTISLDGFTRSEKRHKSHGFYAILAVPDYF